MCPRPAARIVEATTRKEAIMLQTTDRDISVEPRLSTRQTLVLLAAPTVAFIARVLLVPLYQRDDDTIDTTRYFTEVAASFVTNQTGAALTLVYASLYGAAALAIAHLARAGAARLATVGGVFAAFGAFGLATFSGELSTIGQAAKFDKDRAVMISLLERAAAQGVSYPVIVIGALGWVLLGIALYRSRAVPRASAVLTGLGGAAVMLTTPGPLVSFVAGSAVVSFAGLAWVTAAVRTRR